MHAAVAALVLNVANAAALDGPSQQAAALPKRREAATLAKLAIGERMAVAPDGSRALFADAPGGPLVIELETGALVDLPDRASIAAIGFGRDGGALWIARKPEAGDGDRVRELRFSPRLPELPLADAARVPTSFAAGRVVALGAARPDHDLVESPDGTKLAWSRLGAGEGGEAGVVAIEDGRELARFASVDSAAFGSRHVALVAWLDERRLLVHCTDAPRPAGEARVLGQAESCLRVRNVASGRDELRVRPYVSERTPGYLVAGGELLFGGRDERGYHVLRWSPGQELRPLLDRARPGHFQDLFATQDGRFVAEWDFEKESAGAVVLDRSGALPPRTLAPGWSLVGVGRDGKQELLALQREDELRFLDAADGSVADRIRVDPGLRATSLFASPLAQRVLLAGWRSRGLGQAVEYEAQLLAPKHSW